MLYMHEGNLLTKINNNYDGHGEEIRDFYNDIYLPMRTRVLELIFDENHPESFVTATELFNEYYSQLKECRDRLDIDEHSKFSSTFLEEISCYLFKDLPDIQNETFGIYNKKVYAGLKINNDRNVSIITKDVDFCIGKKVELSIDNLPATELIIPVVAVEVKTYLDATMFGEAKSSSKSIRSASPNSKTYILMGYKNLKDDHIIAARQDSTFTELFVLRKNARSPMESSVIEAYWREISEAVNTVTELDVINVPGKLLNP